MSEETFVDPFKVQQIRVAVDAVCITEENSEKFILLIKREYEPFKNKWALPGGFLKEDEEMEEGAIRELKEETQLDSEILIEDVKQLKAYGAVDRDPRPRRIISVAFLVELKQKGKIQVSHESLDVQWVKINDLNLEDLAFDHKLIVQDAISVLEK